MKRKLLLLTVVSTIGLLSNAQKIQYGLTGAINLSSVSGTGMSPKYQNGFEAGAFAAIPLYEKWGLQPEVVYNFLKVSRAENFSTFYVDQSRASSNVAFNLAYVSIPVLITYDVAPKFKVNVGPQYNILVYSNENLLYYKRAFKNNDFGVRGGAQFAPSPTVNLFASYYYGIANTNDINNGDNNYKWKNRQIQIGVNVAIFTGK